MNLLKDVDLGYSYPRTQRYQAQTFNKCVDVCNNNIQCRDNRYVIGQKDFENVWEVTID
jgi:hypothetical protein